MSSSLIYSGYDWVDSVPTQWEKKKLKYLSKIRTGKRDVNHGNEKGEYPFFTCSMYPKKISEYSFDCEALLIAGNGLVGFTQYYNGKFDAYQRTYVISHFKGVHPLFLKYYVSNLLVKSVESKSVGSVIDFIKLGDIKDFPVFMPFEIEKQKSIANFLDKKVEKINELIQVQEDAISKLEEYKQQVISETINFGLEKDNLVESKYEWIKKIPEHWEIEKVARTTYLKGRIGWQGLKSTEFKTEGPHLVTGTDFNNGYVDWDSCVRVTKQRYEEANFIQVQEGDLLITKDGTIGKVAIAQNAPEKVSVNSGIFVTRPLHNEYINKYFYYLMLSNVFKEFFQLTLTGNSTILHLYQGVFSQFRYPLPPKVEQIEIVNYLDKKTEEIEQLIQIKKDKIEKLNEYKKSLIYEAVTGKIEVM